MKRELIEAYYEAHFREIQNSVKTPEIIEKDEAIRCLDEKICEDASRSKTGFWEKYDEFMSLTNSFEDDMFKELYIRGFFDYERLVLGCDKKLQECNHNDRISRKEVLEVLKATFEKYWGEFGPEYGGFGAAVQEAIESLPMHFHSDRSDKLD